MLFEAAPGPTAAAVVALTVRAAPGPTAAEVVALMVRVPPQGPMAGGPMPWMVTLWLATMPVTLVFPRCPKTCLLDVFPCVFQMIVGQGTPAGKQ